MSAAVKDGECLYTSPSALTKADPDEYGGCPRRWYYRYVEGRKEPTFKSQRLGTDMHGELEHYCRTGEDVLGHYTRAALPFVPPPAPDLLIEAPIEGAIAPAGIPMKGFIDLAHARSSSVASEGELKKDPHGRMEVLDWKTTSSMARAAKTPQKLAETIQMVSYGRWAVEAHSAPWVRLSHVYISTKGRPDSKKVTVLRTADQIEKSWEHVEGVARTIKDAAKEPHADKVPANKNACDAYGGCPHLPYCNVGTERAMSDVFGVTGAKRIKERNKEPIPVSNLLSKLKTKTDEPADKPEVETSMADQIAQLEAAEQEAEPAAPPPAPEVPKWYSASVEAIKDVEKGFPALAGAAAKMHTKYTGVQVSDGAAHGGTDLLGQLTLHDPTEVHQLAQELGCEVPPIGEDAAPTTSALPPDAPASDPEKNAAPVEGWTKPETPEAVGGATRADLAKLKKPELKRLWIEHGGDPSGMKKDDLIDALLGDGPSEPKPEAPKPAEAPSEKPTDVGSAAPGLVVFIDAIPEGGIKVESLHSYVDGLCRQLCQEYNAADIRCAPSDSPLGYGKWKGALAAVVREMPPPAGCYVLDTRGSEIAEVAADALRGICDVFVKGVR